MYENKVYGYEDKIESGEMRPEEVDVYDLVYDEETHLTPKLEEQLTPEQREEFARLQRQKIDEKASSRVAKKSDEARQTLDALRTAVDDGEPIEATVYLGEAPVTVTKRITGKLEQHIDAVAKEGGSQNPDFNAVKDHMIEAIFSLIIDDGEDDGYRFTDRVVWEEFYAERGSEALYDVFEIVSEPAIERRERLNKFRDQRNRR